MLFDHLTYGLRQVVGVGRVARDDVHLVVPRPVRQVPRPAGQDQHAEAGREKLRDQTASDVSGGAAHHGQRAGGHGGLDRQDCHGLVLADRSDLSAE